MGIDTHISWCRHTWSPWEGCTKVGPGCEHCYAAARNGRFAEGANWGPGAPRRLTADSGWLKPVAYNRAAAAAGRFDTIFPSLCDPFDNEVDDDWRERFANLIMPTHRLTWLLLTKRPGNAIKMLQQMFPAAAPANVWVGVTIVNQEEATRDRDKVRALRDLGYPIFLSTEPQLGPLDLCEYLGIWWRQDQPAGALAGDRVPGTGAWVKTGDALVRWVVNGGESGPDSRDFNIGWAEKNMNLCDIAGVPFHLKQLGSAPVMDTSDEDRAWLIAQGVEPDRAARAVAEINLHHPKGGDPMEWPERLRVQQFPNFRGD